MLISKNKGVPAWWPYAAMPGAPFLHFGRPAAAQSADLTAGKEKLMQDFTTKRAGLYDPRFEHDNCGIGAVVDIQGRKTHRTIDDALQIVEHLEHRAGKDAEGRTGDGVGILLQISHKFFSKVADEIGRAHV